jgi:hypothetical protein
VGELGDKVLTNQTTLAAQFENAQGGESAKMSDSDLNWLVEASAVQIALRWTVFQWENPPIDRSSDALDLQIMRFSADALSGMCTAYPILRNATEELRWLIYFKGLIAAETHPRDQMLAAIESVRRGGTAGKRPIKPVLESEDVRLSEINPISHADALAAIERALDAASH